MARTKKVKLQQTELLFKMGQVRKLLEHAQSCTEFLPVKKGEVAKDPGVVLVCEFSVYLASNGKDDKPFNEVGRITYANKMDPAQWEDEFALLAKKVELVGIKDDAVFIKASDINFLMGKCEDWVSLKIRVIHDGESIKKVFLMPPTEQIEEKSELEQLFA